ncbi:hypothetical protein SAMN05421508_103364 [Caenispirillum bisanense]|uniref:Uncharacterized protein n=1 Tax=Caenispirillum bisanense TaxID=414052 RepID=A0A286GF21_9PROT|nr:hypothetical protein SAMN05421508_103364 [Caenispirillum bisanense]
MSFAVLFRETVALLSLLGVIYLWSVIATALVA